MAIICGSMVFRGIHFILISVAMGFWDLICAIITPPLILRKIRAPIKIKSALPPPPPKTTPKKGNFTDMVFPAERTHFFQVSIKLAHPFPAPELRTENFTDTRIFLIYQIVQTSLTGGARKGGYSLLLASACSLRTAGPATVLPHGPCGRCDIVLSSR